MLSMKLNKQEATVNGQEGETDERQRDDSSTHCRIVCVCQREKGVERNKKKMNLKTHKQEIE